MFVGLILQSQKCYPSLYVLLGVIDCERCQFCLDIIPLLIVPKYQMSHNTSKINKRFRLSENFRLSYFHSVTQVKAFMLFFLQKYWHIMGPSNHRVVVNAFENGVFDPWINETLLVLISKVERLENLSNFRSISLCNVQKKF